MKYLKNRTQKAKEVYKMLVQYPLESCVALRGVE